MSKKLQVVELGSAARRITDAGHHALDAKVGYENNSASLQGSWGNDKYGQQFAGGSNGFVAYQQQLMDSLLGLAMTLAGSKGVSEGLKQASTLLDQSESESAQGFQ
ncbi:hypothetical protein [Nocardia sp. CDC160]|uniref:hypothetical protein n=1 Tax=Nocardia sp. CDC160 TaxID=3112166 RepID=UPI002DBEA940|nr:hypothetical protein [Nocardia sp. CDC160]MEC3919242.1 hypothetical protein [Nocardia sp. CDC160]